jgi:hypothetical protein
MGRIFNTAGICRPEDHYMLPPEARLRNLRKLVDDKAYFVIHAPRQSGKTTSSHLFAEALTEEGRYAAVLASCKIASTAGADVGRGIPAVIRAISMAARNQLPDGLHPPPPEDFAAIEVEARLQEYLDGWCRQCPRPVVLFLDEIDALVDETLLSVLDQLHSGYPGHPEHAPQALALIGLRDVRDYRGRRPRSSPADSARIGSSSPFKSDSLTLRNFTAGEVSELYGQHTADTGQVFSDGAKSLVAELTGGQPWLVNCLARLLVEVLVPDIGTTIEERHVEIAKEALIRRRDTHVDSLIDVLREDRVRKVIAPILTGDHPEDDVFDDDIQFVKDLGLVTSGPGGLDIANPIYREIVPRALTAASEEFLPMRRATYLAADGRLLWDKVLDGFVTFWKGNAEWMLRRQPYAEAAAQLVFMAWLHRIVNGGAEIDTLPDGVAAIDREYAVGSGRVDVLVRWPLPRGGVERFAVELKVRRDGDGDPLDRGLEQLGGYLDRLGLGAGTLVIFDQRSDAPPIRERCSRRETDHGGCRITVLRL